jgi:hypothetical protein
LTADETPVKGWRIWGDSWESRTVTGPAADAPQSEARGLAYEGTSGCV